MEAKRRAPPATMTKPKKTSTLDWWGRPLITEKVTTHLLQPLVSVVAAPVENSFILRRSFRVAERIYAKAAPTIAMILTMTMIRKTSRTTRRMVMMMKEKKNLSRRGATIVRRLELEDANAPFARKSRHRWSSESFFTRDRKLHPSPPTEPFRHDDLSSRKACACLAAY